MILASLAAIFMILISLVGIVNKLFLPIGSALFGFLYAWFLYIITKSRIKLRNIKILIVLPITVFPFSMFIVSHFINPYGVATYLNAPIVMLYFIGIILTGFMFDYKIPIILGVLYSIEFYITYIMGFDKINKISVPDSLMHQTLTAQHIYTIKAAIILFSGFLVGLLSKNSKRLIENILIKKKEKAIIDKLFGQYVSKEVKNKVLSETKGKIGERKKVALVFTDIRSFTSYTESVEADIVVRQLNEYFNEMIKSIQKNNGYIDKFIGDAIMAVFGGLNELQNPCDSALIAAQMMISELNRLNERWIKKGMHTFSIGIGLHYGEVLQGTIGSDERREFTVIGDVVNTASRLEKLSKKYRYRAIASERFVKKLFDNSLLYEKIGEVQIKGKKEKINIFGYFPKRKLSRI